MNELAASIDQVTVVLEKLYVTILIHGGFIIFTTSLIAFTLAFGRTRR